jgi:hypothetical protein
MTGILDRTFLLAATLAIGCANSKVADRDLDAFLEPVGDVADLGARRAPDGGARDLRDVGDLATSAAVADLSAPAADLSGPAADLSGPAAPADLAGAAAVYASEASSVYAVDTSSWELTPIGSLGLSDPVTDLALLPDGQLLASTSDMLYFVDLSTGKASAAIDDTVALFLPSNIEGLTALDDGKLLMGTRWGSIRVLEGLGSSTIVISSLGNLDGFTLAGDLASTASWALYATADSGGDATATDNQLLVVNNSNGRGTSRGAIGYGYIRGLVPVDGRLVGFSSTGAIVAIDPMSGASTLLKQYADKSFTGAATSPSVSLP